MPKLAGPFRIGLLCIFVTTVILSAMVPACTCQSNNTTANSPYTSNLVLNIYINGAGKVLATGYADDIGGLSFLKDSQYKYDKDTKQLYALTDSLTYKSGEDWEAKLPSQGNYSEYHSIFYLPASARISKIDATPGIEYLVSANNESFQVDLHGYDIKSPTITIDYQLPISESGTLMAPNNRTIASGSPYLMPALLLSGLVLASSAIVMWRRRKTAALAPCDHMHESEKPDNAICEASDKAIYNSSLSEENQSPGLMDDSESMDESENIDNPLSGANQHYIDPQAAGVDENPSEPGNVLNTDSNIDSSSGNSADSMPPNSSYIHDESISADRKAYETGGQTISITSEMAAVMETLTSRERAVLEALINHDGKMIQAEIRYETRIPKSSLTGILLSLERRKLITKKEKGRTNIIELSKWFLSKKKMQ